VVLLQAYDNFARPHRSLRLPLSTTTPYAAGLMPPQWEHRTPGMAAGLMAPMWTGRALLTVQCKSLHHHSSSGCAPGVGTCVYCDRIRVHQSVHCMHQGPPLAYAPRAHAMERLHILLLDSRGRHKAHGRTHHHFRDGLGIAAVIFMCLDIWLDELRCHELHLMAIRTEASRPIMHTALGFYAHASRGQLHDIRASGHAETRAGDTRLCPCHPSPPCATRAWRYRSRGRLPLAPWDSPPVAPWVHCSCTHGGSLHSLRIGAGPWHYDRLGQPPLIPS
jgi:hypothetical protein